MDKSQVESLEEEWQKEYARRYGDRTFKLETAAGVPVKLVYTPKDVEGIDYRDIGLPGVYPFTRGSHPLMYQVTKWTTQQGFGYGLPEHTRERYDVLRKAGLSGYEGMEAPFFLIADEATNLGYDPDHPAARGRVGQCGCTWCTTKDMEIMFHDLPLDKIFTVWNIFGPSPIALAMYIVSAERMGIPKETLRGVSCFYFYEQIYMDHPTYPPENGLKLAAEQVKYCLKNVPLWNSISFDGYAMEEAGANAIQELAFMLAPAIAVVETCREIGLNPDDYVSRFGFHMGCGDDFFETTAKIRALRRIWAKLTKEKFGCKLPKSWRASTLQLETAGSSLTAQQPLNNIVRAALQTLAAVFGGANSIWTTHYDEALSIPTEESATLCLRTQQIILDETNVTNVVDPLGGSYYLEWLTNKLEHEVLEILEKMDKKAYVSYMQTGWFRREIEDSAYKWRQGVDSGEKTKVGVNKYVTEEEQEIHLFKPNPEVERIAIERVKKHRAERDNAKTSAALAELRNVAQKVNDEWPSGGDLMPALVETARADATLGEMMSVMREVFGHVYTY